MVTKVRPFSDDSGRSYSGGQNKTLRRLVLLEGDPRVDALFLEFVNAPKTTIYWDYRDRFIRLTQELIAGNINWFLKQDSNPIITDMRMSFLLDTVRFIQTGKRHVSIHSWKSMLEMESGDVCDVSKRQVMRELFRTFELETFDEIDNNTFIQNWLSHKNGFDDMVFTINYLFGTKAANDK